MMDIVDEVGSVPETHLHCAQLAEATLQRAFGDYHARQGQVETNHGSADRKEKNR